MNCKERDNLTSNKDEMRINLEFYIVRRQRIMKHQRSFKLICYYTFEIVQHFIVTLFVVDKEDEEDNPSHFQLFFSSFTFHCS